jgi:5-methylcytosine-specific restriction enzyme subunit McrC
MARPANGGLGSVKRSIPIENVYFLFCYAWNRFPEGRTIGVGTVDSPKICDLFASVLIRGVNRLTRRGLDRGYTETQDDMSGVRGRIVVGDTLRRNLLLFGRTNCRFDDLNHDILHNQIIKATISRLADSHEVADGLRHELGRLKRLFSEVADIGLSNSSFRRVQLSRNNGNYDLLIKICELVNSALLPHEDGRDSKFSDILEDETLMWGVFQAFVQNFFKAEQTEFSVRSEHILWDSLAMKAESTQYLPIMHTDVTLRSKTRTIVIDTKYYLEALSENFGKKKIRSDHLYQLYAYLKNCKSHGGPPEGILLYPTTSQHLDLAFDMGGNKLRVKTLQLDQPWQKIHAELCALLAAPAQC